MSKVLSWTDQLRDTTLPGTSYLGSLHGKSLSTVPATLTFSIKHRHHFHSHINLTMVQNWDPKSLQMVIAAMKLKDAYSLEGKL